MYTRTHILETEKETIVSWIQWVCVWVRVSVCVRESVCVCQNAAPLRECWSRNRFFLIFFLFCFTVRCRVRKAPLDPRRGGFAVTEDANGLLRREMPLLDDDEREKRSSVVRPSTSQSVQVCSLRVTITSKICSKFRSENFFFFEFPRVSIILNSLKWIFGNINFQTQLVTLMLHVYLSLNFFST